MRSSGWAERCPPGTPFAVSEVMLQRRSVFTSLALALLTGAVFARVGQNGFVNFDDPLFVSENPMVLRGITWDGVIWAFRDFSTGNWHPLTWISHMADVQLFGASAGAHHLVSLALHTINVLLLFNFLGAMTGNRCRSALVAVLFAVHPLHVESVVWVAERKDVLSTFFMLLSMSAWLAYLRKPRGPWYLAGLLLYGFSLMAKPMPVSLPVLLLFLDYWPLGRAFSLSAGGGRPQLRRVLREKAPFAVFAFAACVLAIVSQGSAGAFTSLEKLPAGVRIAQALQGYLWYLGKTLWPSGLAVLYPHSGTGPPLGATVAAAAILLLLTILAVLSARKAPFLATGWLWYLVTLAPVIGLVQVGAQSVADRYTYLPLIGVFVVASWSLHPLVLAMPKGSVLFAATAAGAVLALAISASRQVEVWKDSERLLKRAATATRGNWVAYTNLGVTYARAGRTAEAIVAYRQAISSRPRSTVPYTNLGILLGTSGGDAEALALFRTATAVQPEDPVAWLDLGVCLNRLERHAEAVGAFKKAVALKADYADAYAKLGNSLVRIGAFDEAISVQAVLARLHPQAAAELARTINDASGTSLGSRR
jgi:Flp pilus assembly protein TadD